MWERTPRSVVNAAVFNQGADPFLSFQDVIGIDFRRAPLGSKF